MAKPSSEAESQAHEVERLVHELGGLLHGRDPAVQSAVLADLLAIVARRARQFRGCRGN